MNSSSTQTKSAKPTRCSLKGLRNSRAVLEDLNHDETTTNGANKSQSAGASQGHSFPHRGAVQANEPKLLFRSIHRATAKLAATDAVTDTPKLNKIKKTMESPPPTEVSTAKGKAPSTKKKTTSTVQVSDTSYVDPNRTTKVETLVERMTRSIGALTEGDDFRFDIDETPSKKAIKSNKVGRMLVRRSSDQLAIKPKEAAMKLPCGSSSRMLVADESRDENDQLSSSTSKSPARLNPGREALVLAKRKGTIEASNQASRSFPRGAFTVFRRHRGQAKSNNDDTHHVVASPSIPISLSHSLQQTHLSAQHFPKPITTAASKITVVSQEHKIFVVDMLPEKTCDWILHETTNHVAHCATECRESWRKLYTHTLHDLPCSEVVNLQPFTKQLLHDIRHLVGQLCANPQGATALVPRSWKEPHLLRYGKEHTGMCMHYDGGALTWQIMLSSHGTDYKGT